MGLRPTLGITHEIRYCKISSHFLKRKVGTPKHEMQLPYSSAAMEHTHTSASLEMEDSMNIPQELFLSIS
jgi:hypothetical protein